jgi:hypothetical protein
MLLAAGCVVVVMVDGGALLPLPFDVGGGEESSDMVARKVVEFSRAFISPVSRFLLLFLGFPSVCSLLTLEVD